MLTFLVLLKWALLIAGIALIIGSIFAFNDCEDGVGIACIIFAVICIIGFFIL